MAEKDRFVNIAACLPEMARRRPDALALAGFRGRGADPGMLDSRWTFRELDEESNALARGLESAGIGRGVRTVLMLRPGPEFFALAFALFKAGAIPVLVDPGMGVRNLGSCLDEARPEAFIGSPKAHAARTLFRWAADTLRTRVTSGPRLFWGGLTLQEIRRRGKSRAACEMARTRADDTAAILFTSGSTGAPKGAVYTHGNFAAQVATLRGLYEIEPGEIDLPTFPLFGLFGPALGMSEILPRMDFTRPGHVDPRQIIEPIQRFEVTNLFGSPALLRRVGDYGSRHAVRLPSLKRVISAGAPVPAEVLERFAAMLQTGVQVFTAYGATEAMPVCSLGSEEILRDTRYRTVEGAGVCVGRPVTGVDVNLIPITEDPIEQWSGTLQLPEETIGEIVVQGDLVTREYIHRTECTRQAKIGDPRTGKFFHRLGDLGYRDGQGRLWFCGRKSHRVITLRGTLFTVSVEGVFNQHPRVLRTALVGVGGPGAKHPVLCVELRRGSGPVDRKKVKEELLALGESTPQTRAIRTILFHPSFPVDIRHNAKISREKLAVWAARKLASKPSLTSDTLGPP
ncbi:MAG: AMP-binding protein [Planctomycetes bacterium]|nr:AMP-binding protein [Planctomycetota bacterium]